MRSTPSEEGKKRGSAGRFLFTVFALSVCGAVMTVFAFFVGYAPDPDANINPVFEDMRMPGVNSSDAFRGMTQTPGVYNFLVVGLDRVSRSTDIIMIVSYDVNRGGINVVQIPRDTYCRTSEVKTVVRINAYYAVYYNAAVKSGADDPDMTALSNLAAMIERNFRVRINYSAVVDLDGFENIVDAVGGVDLDIPEDMFYEDPYQDLYIDLKAGYQHLDGYHAMQFVRYRKGYVRQDIGRQDALKNFISALVSQLKSNMSVSKFASLAGTVMSDLRSNISAADFMFFGSSALSVDLSEVLMTSLPGEPATVDGVSVYVLYRDDTVAAINKYLNVFGRELSPEEFDPYSVMVKSDDDDMRSIYEKPLGTWNGAEYNAEDVNENPIDIPRKQD